MAFSTDALKARAAALGFNLVGVTPAVPAATLDAYFRWIEAAMHGSMGYLARPDRQARRRDLSVIVPGARSLVMVGVDYTGVLRSAFSEAELADPARGRIAAYAWGVDYHDVLTPRLETLADWLTQAAGEPPSQRVYVDTGAILERAHARQAGMGFTGKNTMLINRRRGSYFFLGEIITTLEFDRYDTPERESLCGTCTRCLVACPTDAFPRPFVLDARRCISYLTIEHKGWIDSELRPLMGNWVFGCDVCQDVCPWQRFAVPGAHADFEPALGIDRAAPPLLDLLALDEAGFRARFADSPLARIKRDRLVRNACIAAGNWGHEAAAEPLAHLLSDPAALVRGHAAWALARVTGDGAWSALRAQLIRETDADARDEIQRVLDEMG